MSTAAFHPGTGSHDTHRFHYVPYGIGASLVQAALMIPGYNEDGSFQTNEWVGMLAISLVVSALVFSLAVPHGGAMTALVVSIVSCLTVVAFWAMLSIPLAVGAFIVGNRSRTASRPAMATAAVVLSVLAVVATVAITIGDMASS